MPFARISVATESLDPQIEQALASEVTDLLHTVLNKDPDSSVVSVQLYDPRSWFVHRDRVSETSGVTGAHLEVSITGATNTEQERAAFLKDAYQMLGKHLGLLADAVYVALIELDGLSYGYNGISQTVRHGANPGSLD